MKSRCEVGGRREKLPFVAFRRPPSPRCGAPHHPPPKRERMPAPPGRAVKGGPQRLRLGSGQLGLDL
eukprot:12394366-Alexandrium_andersonii.AAC.1